MVRQNFIYMIMAFAMLLFSCQRIELIEMAPVPGEDVHGEVTVSFSALVPSQPATKAMGDDPVDDMQTMHLVVFDEDGMYVETREATTYPQAASVGVIGGTDGPTEIYVTK